MPISLIRTAAESRGEHEVVWRVRWCLGAGPRAGAQRVGLSTFFPSDMPIFFYLRLLSVWGPGSLNNDKPRKWNLENLT